MTASPAAARAFAWAGAGLFAASLGYFLYTYAVTFGEITHGPLRFAPVAMDAALFGAFALHHSLFARERVRAWVARLFSPASERAIYVWIASLMLIGVCALWQPIPGVAWDVPAPAAWGLHAIQFTGIWMSLRSAAIIDIWELGGVKQAPSPANSEPPTPERNIPGTAVQRTHTWQLGIGNREFRTDGPYGWVRHPIYLGWFLLVFAVPRMTMTRLVFAVISGIYILIAIPLEERSLRRASNGAYDAYMRQVPWKLVPGMY